MIIEITDQNIAAAGLIHSESWRDSHKAFCEPDFVEMHSVTRQTNYLRNEIEKGKKVFMLIDNKPVGIVSVWNDLIENLYILPEEQHKGYGTKLLLFAMEQCKKKPSLWILHNNSKAYNLYAKHGFQKTGNSHKLAENLWEIELAFAPQK